VGVVAADSGVVVASAAALAAAAALALDLACLELAPNGPQHRSARDRRTSSGKAS
jgi:hypothetical protein